MKPFTQGLMINREAGDQVRSASLVVRSVPPRFEELQKEMNERMSPGIGSARAQAHITTT